MQIGSSTSLSSQLQALENAALGKYQAGQNFSFLLDQAAGSANGGAATDGAGSTAEGSDSSDDSGYELSGSFQSSALVAVGAMTPDGQMQPFSAEQVQSEEDALGKMRQTSYDDSLKNFLLLAQASGSNGQSGPSSYSDQQQFVGDNGLISASFNSSFSLSSS